MKPAPRRTASRTFALIGVSSMLAAAAVARGEAQPDIVKGAAIYAAQCALCHGSNGGGGQGPALAGVVGRKAASTGFGYSAALKRTGWTWDAAHLDRYLADPQRAVPGTLMPVNIDAAADRREVIAFLAGLKAAAPETVAAAQDPTPPVKTGGGPYADWRGDAPGRRHHITPADLPAPYATESANNYPKEATRPPGRLPQAPPGFKVELFADNLENPREIRIAPNGDVFVSESGPGRIRVLRARDGVGRVERTSVFAKGLNTPEGMAFYPAGPDPKWLYVAERNRVVRFPYRSGALEAGGGPEVVVETLAPTTGGHTTRDIVFSADGERMFVAVGSGSNVAATMAKKPLAEAEAYDAAHGLGATWGNEENRADVLVFTPRGGAGRVYASGLRNCVGMAVQPKTGTLWCSTNERDELGDDLVPDYVTRVKEGAFYGWPWWYIGDHEDPRLKGERPDLKGRITVPDVLIQPHSASLGMTFYTGSAMPAAWRGSAFAAEHGSWNRARRTGPKLVRILLNPDGSPTGEYEDVLTGFTLDDARVFGKPAAVAGAHDGALLVTDSLGGAVWRLSWLGGR